MSDLESRITRLEKKVDRVLQLLESQVCTGTSRSSGSSQGPQAGVYESFEDQIVKKQVGARTDVDNEKDSYTHLKEPGGSSSTGVLTDEETIRTFLSSLRDEFTQLLNKVETLEKRLCDGLNASQRQIMSELQKEIKDMMSTATSSHWELQTKVQQQTGTLENIHGVTNHLSNQLNGVVEQTKDATSRLDAAVKAISQNPQTSQSHMGMSAILNTGDVEQIKAQFKVMVQLAKSSISAKAESDSRMLKEQMDETLAHMLGKVAVVPVKEREILSKEMNEFTKILKEQVCRVLDEVKSVRKETEKCTKEMSQNAQILSKNALQEIQTSVNLMLERVGQMLEGSATSSAHSQYIHTFHKEATEKIQTCTQVMLDKVGEFSKTLNLSRTVLSESIKKSSEENEHGFQTLTDQINQFLDKVEKSNTALSRNAQESSKEETAKQIENWATALADHVNQILQEVKNLTIEVKNEVKTSVKKMTDEIHGFFTALNHEMKNNLQESLGQQSKNTLAHVDKKMKESAKHFKDDIYKLKNEIFVFTEKESQIVRNCMQDKLPQNANYIQDFYVEDFKSLIKSGAVRYSPPWLINEFNSSVRGKVKFLNSGKLDVRMIHSLHPREVGLQPRHCGELKVNAVVFDTRDQLPPLGIGESRWTVNGENITDNRDTGCKVGEIDCQAVLDGQYADIPIYNKDAVLVRFSVDVLQE